MEEIVELTKSLVSFKSMHSNRTDIAACRDFIIDYLKSIGAEHEVFSINGTDSILVTPRHRETEILLMTHYDVVAALDEQFIPKEEDGYLIGRGALDDKYGVAMSLVLLKEALQKHEQSELTFGILMTGDEEKGGFDGAKHVLSKLKAEFCIAIDGGSPTEIITKSKGLIKAKLICRGKSGHGSRPWLGINAIELLMDDLQKVRSLFVLDANKEHWHKTLNIGSVIGGVSFNQVPDYAEAILDIRYTQDENPNEICKEIQDLVGGVLEIQLKEPVLEEQPSEHLERLLKIVPNAKTTGEHGSSDARFLKVNNIKGIVWGADDGMTMHGPHERLDIKSMNIIYESLRKFLGLA
ncbi:M20/M25/M40 family metallo-hydrolase [Candidatus Woesearchaeota archaeon]|nr:M20/M25/M40 family metallo-hydrolase [Candidatus Woesearchaeota archaeon]